ncbi:ribonuclease P 40kDa subunit-domain-containing protein [Cristinia sonorae]|uniref:Ribonuclease P 40kDa subunit-domain-containing protein n=1 Tax=Cristinia sonorae TaxID=1940300 RepID=A0A8K0UTF5_9AGAR|nr:ribonuclease P 40kDa subunit-domain-containing protein [Cristinia sonorae]
MEKRRTVITVGEHDSSDDTPESNRHKKIQSLASSHPFTAQENVVFPASENLLAVLSSTQTVYGKRQWTVNEFIEYARPILNSSVELLALGSAPDTDDVWSLDPRGVLTLSVGKETYERLGIVGSKLPWKSHQHIHNISVSLIAKNEHPSHPYSPKIKAAFEAWDQRHGLWDVLFSCDDSSSLPNPGDMELWEVKPRARELNQVRIPNMRDIPFPSGNPALDSEEWGDEIGALFEWVGMASLGSQRLPASDSVDPYLAVYDPPLPMEVGDLVSVRWTGFLTPGLVVDILNRTISAGFVAITGQSFTNTPVAHMLRNVPSKRVPKRDGEDTWCMVIATQKEGSVRRWVLAESVGPHDTRWG